MLQLKIIAKKKKKTESSDKNMPELLCKNYKKLCSWNKKFQRSYRNLNELERHALVTNNNA